MTGRYYNRMPEALPLSPLASNLRMWRTRRGMTVSSLARQAGVSKSTISDLERGNGNPSLDTLWALAKSLHVSLGAFFMAPTGQGDMELRRLVEAPVIAREGDAFIAQLMAGWQTRGGEVELSVVSLAAGATRNSQGNAPDVVERAVCVSGRVSIGPQGREVMLQPGDMLTFRADQPHVYRAFDEDVRLVVVQQYPAMP